jgi:hypothetical protein
VSAWAFEQTVDVFIWVCGIFFGWMLRDLRDPREEETRDG